LLFSKGRRRKFKGKIMEAEEAEKLHSSGGGKSMFPAVAVFHFREKGDFAERKMVKVSL